MTEEVLRSRKSVQKKRKKKRKLSGRGIFVIVLAILILVGGFFVYKQFFAGRKNNGEGANQARQYTSFQQQINAEYEAAKGTFTGDQAEVDLVGRYFATNIFTLWGVTSENDYNGKDMIPKDNFNDFDQQMKNNLVFQFNQIVSAYGAENLSIVTATAVSDITSEKTQYADNYYNGYATTLTMSYQDGTVPGTTNADTELASQFLQNWVHSADVTFFWIPAETGDGGEWKVASMTHLISNKKAAESNEESTTNTDLANTDNNIDSTSNVGIENASTINNETTANVDAISQRRRAA